MGVIGVLLLIIFYLVCGMATLKFFVRKKGKLKSHDDLWLIVLWPLVGAFLVADIIFEWLNQE